MLSLILKENSFQFNGKNYLQVHGTAMGTKMAVAFANIFMAKIETQILSKTVKKPTVWKRYIEFIGLERIMGEFESRDFLKPRGLVRWNAWLIFRRKFVEEDFSQKICQK